MTRSTRSVPVLILALLMLFPALALLAREKPASTEIVCASIYSGDRTIHFKLDRPISATSGAVRAEFVRIGQGMQLRALASGIQSDRLLGAAIVEAAANGDTWTGNACYYRFPSGGVYYAGCDPSCSGPGCMGIRVRAQK